LRIVWYHANGFVHIEILVVELSSMPKAGDEPWEVVICVSVYLSSGNGGKGNNDRNPIYIVMLLCKSHAS